MTYLFNTGYVVMGPCIGLTAESQKDNPLGTLKTTYSPSNMLPRTRVVRPLNHTSRMQVGRPPVSQGSAVLDTLRYRAYGVFTPLPNICSLLHTMRYRGLRT